jgi:hypothetical protein
MSASRRFPMPGLISIPVIIFIVLAGCTKDPSGVKVDSCEGCHTNYAHLQEVYSPDTAAGASGCGGDAPVYMPYDRVFMGGAGYLAYQESGHYAIGLHGVS